MAWNVVAVFKRGSYSIEAGPYAFSMVPALGEGFYFSPCFFAECAKEASPISILMYSSVGKYTEYFTTL